MSRPFSIKDRIKSFRYAFQGLLTLVKNEHNFRIHLLACLAVITVGLLLDVSATDWRWLTLCMGMTLAAEAFNSAIEYLVDLKQPEKDPLAGKIKDIAAAAVLVVAITAMLIGLWIFWPYLNRL